MSARPLSASLQAKAQKECNEIPDRVQEDLQHIRKWIEQQPHLKARTDDQWLLSFLRGCKFSLQRTKEKFELYYTLRFFIPEYSTNRDPYLPDMQEFFKRGIFVPLPKTAGPAGSRVFIGSAKHADPGIITPTVGARGVGMILDMLMMDDDNITVAGGEIIIDLEDIPFTYAVLITPDVLKKWALYLQHAFPLRLQSMNFINIPSYAMPVLRILKACASKKNGERIHFYNKDNINEMHKSIPISILPTEYGGEAGPMADILAQNKAKVESYRDWLMEDSYYRSDETKRLGEPIISADMFGADGSFRKLEID